MAKSQPVTELEVEVTEIETVIDSAIALISGIAALVAAGVADAQAGDFAALNKLKADLDTKGNALAAAVAANTPAAP